MSKKSFVSINKYAASMPCLFCGNHTSKSVHLEGCKRRGYEDVGFFICNSCKEELVKELKKGQL